MMLVTRRDGEHIDRKQILLEIVRKTMVFIHVITKESKPIHNFKLIQIQEKGKGGTAVTGAKHYAIQAHKFYN